MASLSEMMAYAERESDIRNPLAGNIQRGIIGFVAGQEQKKADAKQQLDTYLKLIDIQEKIGKIKQAEQERKTQQSFVNMMKANGMIPYSPEENEFMRVNANSALGTDPMAAPHTNTETGKLGKMLKENYDMLPTYDGKSFGMRFSKKGNGRGSSAEENRRLRIYQLSRQAAIDKKFKEISPTWDVIRKGPLTRDNVSMNLTQDEIAAFIPAATDYVDKGVLGSLNKKGKQDKKEAFPFGDPNSAELDSFDFNSVNIDEEE